MGKDWIVETDVIPKDTFIPNCNVYFNCFVIVLEAEVTTGEELRKCCH